MLASVEAFEITSSVNSDTIPQTHITPTATAENTFPQPTPNPDYMSSKKDCVVLIWIKSHLGE